jgi:outer membrane protein with beta-barrel domain
MDGGLISMRRAFAAAAVFFLFSLVASAQLLPKGNVFVGYSYTRADFGGGSKGNLNGWDGSLEGKIFPFVGIVADLNGNYGGRDLPSLFHVNLKEYNFLFGPRVSVSVGKVRPFAHVLIGAAHENLSATGFSDSDTSFATAPGGGMDYKLMRLVAWRFQGDYLQTRLFSNTQNNFRFTTGLVLNF